MRNEERYMKDIIILILCLACLLLPQAMCLGATYYCVDATNGNDNNDGLSLGSAWKTIAKVNSQTFRPGDSVLFKRGEVWRERLIVPSSGKAGAPITFAAYGTGEKPEINGADVITEWSLYKGNIYVANVSSKVTQLFVDGEKQVKARWPNSGWLNIDANSGNNISLYSNSLTQPDNYWVGATIAIKTQPFWIEVRTVGANTMHTITWDYDLEYGTPRKDYGFYLEGEVEEIDIPGEWCYSTGKVYLCMAGGDNPGNHLIQGSVRNYGIGISVKKYVDVEGITIRYPSTYGIEITYPNHIYVRDNVILFSERGINVYSPGSPYDYIYINNNRISDTRGCGIGVWGSNYCEITNNELIDIASDEISPRWGCGIWVGNVNNLVVSGNRVDRVSYGGIYAGGDQVTISHNVISNCLLFLGDGGGIYTAGNRTYFHITNNIVSNVVGNLEGTPSSDPEGSGVGIYLDEISSGYEVAGNIVFDCDLGIQLHRAYNNTVVNNSLYNNTKGMWLQEKDPDEMHDNNFYNNILLCASSDQLTWYESTHPASTSVVMGKYNYNLHHNPYREDVIIYDKGENMQRYTLETWRTFSGQEANAIWSAPLFLDTVNRNFHLKSKSPCIDAGVDVGLREDFNRIKVPQGSAPDIGAHEYPSSYNAALTPKLHIMFLLQFSLVF